MTTPTVAQLVTLNLRECTIVNRLSRRGKIRLQKRAEKGREKKMMAHPVHVEVGYQEEAEPQWRYWERDSLVGCDVTIVDGRNNQISIFARDGDIGYRILVNGKEIACEP